MAWARNGTPDTLGGTSDTLEITDLTAYKFNQFLYHALGSGTIQGAIQVDSDGGSNYAYRDSYNGGADGTGTSTTYLRTIGPPTDLFIITYMINIASEEKLFINFIMTPETAGAANAPSRRESVGKYNDGSSNPQVTAFSIDNIDSGDYAAGTNLSALGTD